LDHVLVESSGFIGRRAGRDCRPTDEALRRAPTPGTVARSPPSQAVGGQQYDPAAPDVLLRAVAVGHHPFHAGVVGSVYGSEPMGILRLPQSSDRIH